MKGVPNMIANMINAIGMGKATSNEENPLERRCDISINGDELAWVVQRLWLANKFLGR